MPDEPTIEIPPMQTGRAKGKTGEEVDQERAEWYEEVLPQIIETRDHLRSRSQDTPAPPGVAKLFRRAADELDAVLGEVLQRAAGRFSGSDVEMNAVTRVLDLGNLEARNARALVRRAMRDTP